MCVPIGMQNASPEPLAAGDAFCIRRWASAEIQACIGYRPYATITGGRDEEMPDDYFNRQQNQHKPRYAAGSDMDSIYTGREVPDGGFGKKKDRSTLIAAIVGAVILLWALPQILSAIKQDAQPAETTAPNDSAVQTSDQRTLQKIVTGEVDKDITGAFYSEDRSKLSVEAYIANNKNKSIYDIVVTFTVTDNAENVLAEKVINTPAELASGETGDYTTIIETPSKPTGETHVQMGTTYKIRYE